MTPPRLPRSSIVWLVLFAGCAADGGCHPASTTPARPRSSRGGGDAEAPSPTSPVSDAQPATGDRGGGGAPPPGAPRPPGSAGDDRAPSIGVGGAVPFDPARDPSAGVGLDAEGALVLDAESA